MKKIELFMAPSLIRDTLEHILTTSVPNIVLSTNLYENKEDLFTNGSNLAHIVIVDIHVEPFEQIVQLYKNNNKKVIAWIDTFDEEILHSLFLLNLDGYFYIGMDSNEVTKAFLLIMQNEQYIYSKFASLLLHSYIQLLQKKEKRPPNLLSAKEWEVFELLVKGKSNSEIASKLYITENTVKNHVRSIFKKINVRNRTNAVIKGLRNGWFIL